MSTPRPAASFTSVPAIPAGNGVAGSTDVLGSRGSRWLLLTVCLVAVGLRGLLVWERRGELSEDRDAYLALAAGLAGGRGYSSPGSTHPTAYRPPLYPLLLAASPAANVSGWVAAINLAAGIGTAWLTVVLGHFLGLAPSLALAAGLLVAIDPLLVRYASQPMTETVGALLAAALLTACERWQARRNGWSALSAGVLMGLCVLCRPTFWAYAGLLGAWIVVRWKPGELPAASPADPEATPQRVQSWWSACLAAALGLAVVVGPWVIRNQVVLGAPVLTTTHGGYTLLLGNNPQFYQEVIRQPWGTVWDGRRGPGQQAWVESIERELTAAGVRGEVARDRWMSARAWRHIREDPGGFVQASLHRLTSLWNITPRGPAAEGWPTALLWGVGLFYLLEWAAVAVGVVSVLRRRDAAWEPLLLLLAAFTAVHLLYWTNVRMRAPLVPALALLAVRGWGRLWAVVLRRRSSGTSAGGAAATPESP